LLEDGEHADFPGWRMRAVHTPGHTPGHLSFAEEGTGLFFSGDHVLPRISPNISTSFGGSADPLGDYLDSLAAVRDLDPAEVVPRTNGASAASTPGWTRSRPTTSSG
jgi:glyoxylase-like metal-dependent hydrolase (beta-lactamase superfamily II)